LEKGGWVETNGYSAIFPSGILVGQISEISNSRDGLSYRLKVNLSTDFGNLRDVCVINDTSLVERATLLEQAADLASKNL
jgi:rod shape-determining protein MreC